MSKNMYPIQVVPKYRDRLRPIAEDGHNHVGFSSGRVQRHGEVLPQDLRTHWRPEKHLAFPKIRDAYILQRGGDRVVYAKSPAYAVGGSAKCYIGLSQSGEFCLVRRHSVHPSEEVNRQQLMVDGREWEARLAFAADLIPRWRVAVPSRKTPGAFKIYSVEPLLKGSASGLAQHVQREGQVLGAFMHHFMEGLARELAVMHGSGSSDRKAIQACAHNDVKADNVCIAATTDDSRGLSLEFRLIDFELTEKSGNFLHRSNVNIRPHELVEGASQCRTGADMFAFGLACLHLILEEESYGEIARQDHTVPSFSQQHLALLDAFETARERAEHRNMDETDLSPIEKRFLRQWATVFERVPEYLADILLGCLRKDIGTRASSSRWHAQNVLTALAAHPLSQEDVGELNRTYQNFVDVKQRLGKISAAVLYGALGDKINGCEAYGLAPKLT